MASGASQCQSASSSVLSWLWAARILLHRFCVCSASLLHPPSSCGGNRAQVPVTQRPMRCGHLAADIHCRWRCIELQERPRKSRRSSHANVPLRRVRVVPLRRCIDRLSRKTNDGLVLGWETVLVLSCLTAGEEVMAVPLLHGDSSSPPLLEPLRIHCDSSSPPLWLLKLAASQVSAVGGLSGLLAMMPPMLLELSY